MADYCTVAEVTALAPESGLAASTSYDAMLGVLITATSRLIDREVGRWENFFYPSSDAATRYYDGSGTTELWVDEMTAAPTSVAVSESGGVESSDYTVWSSSDYLVLPYNSTPKYKLEVDTLNGSRLYFYNYRKSVKIVGVFGYSTIPPADVAMACKIQVHRWFMRAKQMFADNGAQQDLGQIIVNVNQKDFIGSKLDPDVAAILHHYKVGMGTE